MSDRQHLDNKKVNENSTITTHSQLKSRDFLSEFDTYMTFSKPNSSVQPKLTIGQPNDKYEQEADRVAAQVVQQIHSPQKTEEKPVQRVFSHSSDSSAVQRHSSTVETVSSEFETSLDRSRSGGSSLSPQVKEQMESAMGADFSGVKVHTDNRSDQLNRSIQAKAFTTGNDIFFQQGAYQPNTITGQTLLAHELTHTIQQGAANRKVQRLIDESIYNQFQQYEKTKEEQAKWKHTIGEIISLILPKIEWHRWYQEKDKFIKKVKVGAFIPTSKQFNDREKKLEALHFHLLFLIERLREEQNNRKIREDNQITEEHKEKKRSFLKLPQRRHKKTELESPSTELEEKREISNLLVSARILRSSTSRELQDLKSMNEEYKGRYREDVYKEDTEVDLNNFKVLGKGNCNEVSKGAIDGSDGEWVWKADESEFAGDGAVKSGLSSDRNVNMGNRNIAMAALDELLGTGVIPETKRAHSKADDTAGTLMKLVGDKALASAVTIQEDKNEKEEDKHRELVANDIGGYEQSIVQEKLSNIQLLDAICGQIDRHGGNIRVVMDENDKVVSVWGIDNDFAFGTDITVDPGQPISKHRGYPSWVDSKVAQTILKMPEGKIREKLDGLLTNEEIEATERRFQMVRGYIESIRNSERIVEEWNEETYRAQIKEGFRRCREKDEPVAKLQKGADELLSQMQEIITDEEIRTAEDFTWGKRKNEKMDEKLEVKYTKYKELKEARDDLLRELRNVKGRLYGVGQSEKTQVSDYSGSYLFAHALTAEDFFKGMKDIDPDPRDGEVIELPQH